MKVVYNVKCLGEPVGIYHTQSFEDKTFGSDRPLGKINFTHVL